MKHEEILHKQVCAYIKAQYPDVIFFSEPSGLRVNHYFRKLLKALRSSHSLPDLFIAYPSCGSHGLFLELKKEGTIINKKNGELTCNEHIREQHKVLSHLNAIGYMATFSVGFEQSKKIIYSYINKTK